ncbi:hypothetical protein ACQ4PT_011645 [Festuca glaucescens]
MVRANRAVAELTDKILTTRPPQLTIRDLKLTFVLRHDHCLSIGRSVARAMATRKLDSVQFKILTEKHSFDCTPADLLRFGKQLNAFFADCQDAFAGLTTLELQNLRFGESDLPNILGTCKRLEYLSLALCDAGIGSLKFEHDRLVELKIEYGEYETVELCRLPMLQRMTCDFWDHDRNPLVFGFVPQLSKLSLLNFVATNVTLPLSQLLANVPDICDHFINNKIWVRPESPRVLSPVLSKLRIVNLDNIREGSDISWTMFILEAAPSLEELSITVWDHACHGKLAEKTDVKWEPCDSDFKHANLANKLTIFGFQPDKNFMGYVTHVVKAAVRIKEVTLHDMKVCNTCVTDGVELCPSRYPRTSEEKYSCFEKIIEGLVMSSPVMIHFWS